MYKYILQLLPLWVLNLNMQVFLRKQLHLTEVQYHPRLQT